MIWRAIGRPVLVKPVWSKISNASTRLGFRSRNFLAQLSETSRACAIRVRRSSSGRLGNDLGSQACLHHGNRRPGTSTEERISVAEKRILKAQFKGRLLLFDAEKATLAEIAQRLGRKALEELSAVAKPDTLLAWYRKLIANKFDGSRFRQRVGRPRIDEEAERLVLQMAKENPSWGYDRIVGALEESRTPVVASDGGQHSPSAWPLSCS